MKGLWISTAILFALPVAAEQAATTEYLCYMTLKNGKEWLAEYSLAGAQRNPLSLEREVKAVGAFAKDGTTMMPIASVVECIAPGETFNSEKARLFMDASPR